MHYRTPRIGFLETEDEFVALMQRVQRLEASGFETAELPDTEGPLVVIPAVP